jgi:cytochrome c553
VPELSLSRLRRDVFFNTLVILYSRLFMTRTLLTWALTATFAFALTVAGAASSAFAQDGKALFTAKGCPTCHGPDGGKPLAPGYPKTKGQDKTYIINQIKAFKDGNRKCGLAELMVNQLKTVPINDKEAEAIATYLSSQK